MPTSLEFMGQERGRHWLMTNTAARWILSQVLEPTRYANDELTDRHSTCRFHSSVFHDAAQYCIYLYHAHFNAAQGIRNLLQGTPF